MKNLLLTLGHNSSAILIEDGELKWGYETERLTGVKSDSRFPAVVLTKHGFNDQPPSLRPDMVYVTHWDPSGALSNMGAKYWNSGYFDGVPCRTLGPDRTHHDTHLAGAACYAGPRFTCREGLYALVIDGFGTMGEHLSIYRYERGAPVLIRRVHGYETSLGLWYQYATSFMGMKMHQDEYKLLGYEAHCPIVYVGHLNNLAELRAGKWLDDLEKSIYKSIYDPIYDLSALDNIRAKHYNGLSGICRMFDIADPSSYEGRCILSYYVQRVLEEVVVRLLRPLKPQHLLCSGGVFLNVKLNRVLIDQVPGQLCVYPLAGDQGNAIGLYTMDHPNFRLPDHLFWGERALENYGKVDGLHYLRESDALNFVMDQIKDIGYVNIVRGAMEFGPRALCNTSTIALPTSRIVEQINHTNERNTIMPMAPVMLPSMYEAYFVDTEKVWKSEEHMIVALRYKSWPEDDMMGVAHGYLTPEPHFTGRPQVVDQRDRFMYDLLVWTGQPLINTSFNYHGQPIAFDTPEVIRNHMMQRQRDPSIQTVIITS